MDDHLDFEDAEILPLFERHFDANEYTALDEQAKKSLGIGKQAAFTVPLVAWFLDERELDHILGEVPAAFRVLYRLLVAGIVGSRPWRFGQDPRTRRPTATS